MVQHYVEHCRHAVVDRDYVTDDGFHLGRWADRQRNGRIIRTLPKGREAELEAINFDWQATPPAGADNKYRKMVLELATYREKHGSGEVPSTFVSDDGEPVGEWLYRKVRKWRDGELPVDEQSVLSFLGVSPAPRARGPRTATRRPTVAAR
ncbi:helicase associated domain-containing protein [Rhodococcus sp. B50]|uniref:helicase associated domain-containing protein n=1 Tax=Rhodococcus sp. B50 TaxID=2682847 RepID=UPI001FCFDFA5|nr:helicase associated domain-containing protein [Rhodococcus sp. B50]MBS9376347.1 hypothetical protein [Rhodococcus sp. B50]